MSEQAVRLERGSHYDLDNLATFIAWSGFIVVVLIFVWILGEILVNGISVISWEFLTESPGNAGRSGGILPILVSTGVIVFICLAFALPMGVATAVYLNEYTLKDSRFAKFINISIDVLAAIPSIIYGLFGFVFFNNVLGFGFSLLSGGLTLACMVLPFVIRASIDGLKAVPDAYRESSTALAMSKSASLFYVIIPSAMPGIIAGFLLGIGRALAETAALLFTSGYVDRMPSGVMDSGRALSIHVYDLAMNVSGGDANAYGSAFVLIVVLLVVNSMAIYIGNKIQRRQLR